MIWTLAPVLISVTAFFVYILQGNELTVGTAFTSIALFGMLRYVLFVKTLHASKGSDIPGLSAPLNVLPAWIVQILQVRFAHQYIGLHYH